MARNGRGLGPRDGRGRGGPGRPGQGRQDGSGYDNGGRRQGVKKGTDACKRKSGA